MKVILRSKWCKLNSLKAENKKLDPDLDYHEIKD